MAEKKQDMEKVQEKYLEFQMLDKHIKEMHQQLQAFEQQREEIKGLIMGMEEVKNVKPGTSLLVPISSGVFLKAKTEETQRFYLNVGAGVVVDKNVDDSRKLMQKQLDKVKDISEQMTNEMAKLISKASPLQEELKKYVEE